MLNLDQIEQDLAWARDNADRSAQTRLFVHHVPAMLVVLRALEESQAQGDEAEEALEVEENSEEPAQPDVSVTGESGEAEGGDPVAESESVELEVELEEDVEASLDAEVEAVSEESGSIFPDED